MRFCRCAIAAINDLTSFSSLVYRSNIDYSSVLVGAAVAAESDLTSNEDIWVFRRRCVSLSQRTVHVISDGTAVADLAQILSTVVVFAGDGLQSAL